MTKKLISCVLAVALILSFAAVAAYAEGTRLTIVGKDAVASVGGDVTVQFTITTDGASVLYFAFDGAWNKDVLTFKNAECKTIIEEGITVVNVDEDAGTFEYVSLSDTNGTQTFTDAVILEMTFTAPDHELDVPTEITLTAKSDEDEAYVAPNLDPFPADEVSVTSAKVSVVKDHEKPSINGVSIDGTGEVGKALTAVPGQFTDNWGLTPEYSYSWTIDGEEVSTDETYTPDSDAIGKTVTVSVTAKVTKDGEAVDKDTTDAVTATKEIVADPTKTSEVKGGTVTLDPAAPKAGKAVKAVFEVEPSINGGDDASEVEWLDVTNPDAPLTLARGTAREYTPATDGIKLQAKVYPKSSNDADFGAAKESPAVDVSKASSSKHSSGGLNGPSLVPGKQDANNNNNNNSGTIDKDKFILTIDQKEASVWGVTKVSDVAPLIKNDRTMLPIRFVAENLGFTVGWDEATKTVTITKDGKVITLVIDSDIATVDGKEVKLDSPAYIYVEAGRTMVPLRFIAENLGYSVDWVETLRQVIITK